MLYTPHYNSNTYVLAHMGFAQCCVWASKDAVLWKLQNPQCYILVTNKSTNLMLKQHFIAIIRTVQDLSGTFPHLLAQGQGQRSTKTALFKDLMYLHFHFIRIFFNFRHIRLSEHSQ